MSNQTVSYYFNSYDTVTEKWTTDPENMADGDTGTYATTATLNQVELLDGNTCAGNDLGTIISVEIRVYGFIGDVYGDVYLRPIFSDGDGDNHTVNDIADAWSNYFDITNDTNAPDRWTWSLIDSLKCDVEYFFNNGLGAGVCKVEIRVTYYIPIPASKYSVELRNKAGELKRFLTPFITKINWEWNRIGGCGRCSITINKAYRDIIFDARDDIQIRIESGATSKLVYRGFIANITPILKINQDITLDVRGYFDLFKKIVVHDTGDTKTYTTLKVSEIVDSIADTFITPNSDIVKGTIEDGAYTSDLDTIDFLGTVDEALRTLADIAGDIEYGVDEDLTFYWMEEHTTISHRFFVGNNVSLLERKVSYDNIVNKIYLVGGDVLGVKYKKTGEATDSQLSYGLVEEIINNSSITTDGVATQYMTAILSERAVPQFSIRAQIKNIDTRLEDTIPMGLVTFYDATYDRDSLGDMIGDIIGESSDGGSDITIGEVGDGGSDVIIGGQYSAQIDRISYEPSDTPGRFNIDIQLGDVILETAAKIKRLERELASLTQY